jgi:hypothetical protein
MTSDFDQSGVSTVYIALVSESFASFVISLVLLVENWATPCGLRYASFCSTTLYCPHHVQNISLDW